MPSPVTPQDFEELIPAPGSSVCEKFFLKLLRKFPEKVYALIAYERNEDGTLSDDFKTDVCSLNCAGGTGTVPGSGGNVGTLTTPVISATDGTFTDHVVVTWSVPAGATRYEIWRGPDSNVANAHKIADVNSVNTYSDTTVDIATIYWYFVRAFNDSPANSSYSIGDSGYAGSLIPTLGSATDLVATKGIWSRQLGALVELVWTKVPNAQMWDIYRNTVNDYTTATRIDTNRTPYVFNNAQPINYGTAPQLVDNGTELCYHDTVSSSANDPRGVTNYYYWVVAKRANPDAIGGFSNSNIGALGWGYGQGQGIPIFGYNSGLVSGGASQTIPVGAVRAWVTFSGSFAGGAGGNAGFGGGGGGAGCIITGLMDVAAASKFRLVSSPEADPGSGASATSGTDGPQTKLQYSAIGDFSDTVDICTANAPKGGLWNPAGGGAGGAGDTGTATVLSPVNIYAGRGGFAASGQSGGDSGYLFGSFRGPPCPLKILEQLGDSSGGHAGGGADSDSNFPSQALGGKGARGRCFLTFY